MKTLTTLIFLFVFAKGYSQTTYSVDVQTPQSIVAALYDVISGDKGAVRDWARFRNLFSADGKLIPTRKTESGDFTIKALTPDEYVQIFTTRVTTGFYETEIHRKEESFGTIAHIFSTYETREQKDGPLTARGINSIQLLKTKDRYYIVTVFWCAESAMFPLPDQYLK